MPEQGSLLASEPLPLPPAADRHAALALACAAGVGPVRWQQLARRHGGADAALAAALDPAARDRASATADAALRGAARAGASLLLLGDPAYPPPLLELPDPPPALWLLGELSPLSAHERAIAVVGTRRMSDYGARTTRALVAPLTAAGAIVVSGMALGVDGAAHAAAHEARAATVAVLGTGVDVPYPAAHRRLHARIAATGAVLSEQLPGATGTPGAFPRRNRIIAALARATLVVEAGHTSGALITAGIALDLARTVAAVPGPIDDPRAAGCNRLLRDGALVVADADDALALLGFPPRKPIAAAPSPAPPGLGDDELAVWRALASSVSDLDALAASLGLPARRCIAAVAMLEVAGLVETDLDGTLRRRS